MLSPFREALLTQRFGRLTELAESTGFRLEDISRFRQLARLIETRDPRLLRLVDGLGLRYEDAFDVNGPAPERMLGDAVTALGVRA